MRLRDKSGENQIGIRIRYQTIHAQVRKCIKRPFCLGGKAVLLLLLPTRITMPNDVVVYFIVVISADGMFVVSL